MVPLIAALRDPACYPHPVAGVAVVETHISWVLLAGEFAYKIKKPVRLPFLDFSSLAARRHYCEEELRLNRRTAPELYLEVVAVTQAAGAPRFGGAGEPLEYAVRMRRFPDDALADRLARDGALGPARIDAIARALARFHASLPAAGGGYGSAAQVVAPALGNFEQLAALPAAAGEAAQLAGLQGWTVRECARLAPVFDARRDQGFVRECHGDLHLGNIAFLGERAVPFDGIEFDPALRCIDVASELAFVAMDLRAHGLQAGSWRLLDACLASSGDYAAAAVLRFYLVYRAMVRAKIACLQGAPPAFGAYLALAAQLAAERRPALVLMHGLPGSGKTTVSQQLLERLGAVRLRSDVERKRLHGIADPQARSGSGLDAGIYSAAASAATYAHLAGLAHALLQAGYPVVVDAAFLRRADRDRFRALAHELGVPFLIAACRADGDTLRRRLAARTGDASEADAAVLERQAARADALAGDEAAHVLAVDTGNDALLRAGIEHAAAQFAAAEGAVAAH